MSLRFAALMLLWISPSYGQGIDAVYPPPPINLLAHVELDGSRYHLAVGADTAEVPLLRPERFWKGLGAGALGATLGLGLGFAIADGIETYEEGPIYDRESEYAFLADAAPFLGLWVGGTIGAVYGGAPELEPSQEALFALGAGSLFGTLAGGVGGESLAGGSRTGMVIGGIIGSAVGAMFGLAMAEQAE